jgi:2-polyprenyl-6-methoxyphenol hydroxylase-like FAD-dependent oxidoreductase
MTDTPEGPLASPTSSSPRATVLVVGAGPVGLVAACELARQGIRARLIDALPTPTTQSRAVGVHARTQDLLEIMGVLDRFHTQSLAQHYIEIDRLDPGSATGVHPLLRIDMADMPTRNPTILNLAQTETEAILRARAQELGVELERGVSLTGLEQDADGVHVTLSSAPGEESAAFDWVVGADGGHSAVRALSGSKLHGSFEGVHFAMADVYVDSPLERDVTRLFASTEGLTVMMCMPERTRLLFQIPAPDPDATAPTLDEIQKLASDRMGPSVRVHDPVWLTYYTIHHALIPEYRVGRVLLAGDAAHIHSPAGAQGMNTGMQDAANLAWKLALVCRGISGAELLDSYHAERHPIGEQVVRNTTIMADTMTLSRGKAKVRDALATTAGHIKPLMARMAEFQAELLVAYPSSPIVGSSGHRPLGSVRSGEFIPDAAILTTPGGDPVSVLDLLAPGGHVLLALAPEAGAPARLRTALGELGRVVPVLRESTDAGGEEAFVLDPTGAFARTLHLEPGGFALVRPDGYIGYLSTTDRTPEFAEYVRRALHAHAGDRSAVA